jgi:hypothetical protein
MILNGFFLEGRGKQKGPNGDYEFVIIEGYDPIAKSLTSTVYWGNGQVERGTLTWDGNACILKSKATVEGKPYETRFTYTFSADGMSATYKSEFSPDGKTWTVNLEEKGTKTQSAPKE